MSTQSQIDQLNDQLEELAGNLAEVEGRARLVLKNQRRARWHEYYYKGILALRKPEANYAMWTTGVLTVGPAAGILLTFVLGILLGLPGGAIFWLAILAAIICFLALSVMLNFPATRALPKLIADKRFEEKEFQDEAAKLTEEAKLVQQKIALTQATIVELRLADVAKREQLLERNWLEMRDAEWDDYVAEVFAALGAQAEPMPNKEHGIDLLVRYGASMIAVESQGYIGSVGIETVKQAVTGRFHYGCDRAAVITNSRFAAPARAYAASHQCFLIGEQEFPAFVMGSNLELFK
jgi:HJR/Mrr/RecB family endonuclease